MEKLKGLMILLISAIVLVGCKTTAKRFELINNEMILVEKMELKGVGKNEADFKAKKIKNDSGFKVPFGDTTVRDLSSSNVN